jgi:hypothetical protein
MSVEDFGNWRSERAQHVLAQHAAEQEAAGITAIYDAEIDARMSNPAIRRVLYDMGEDVVLGAIADGFIAGARQKEHPIVPHIVAVNRSERGLKLARFDLALLDFIEFTDANVYTFERNKEGVIERTLHAPFTKDHEALLFEQVVELEANGLTPGIGLRVRIDPKKRSRGQL